MRGSALRSKDMGCPIPPAAPRTATARLDRAEVEKPRWARVEVDRAIDRANILGIARKVLGRER